VCSALLRAYCFAYLKCLTYVSLPGALSLEVQPELGITHVLSVCPDYSSQAPNHLTIAVQDTEFEDLLIHLSKACRFIQTAFDDGGKVLVHCVQGISRSATVVCAYCE
jgi:dual specificity phosphatase 12